MSSKFITNQDKLLSDVINNIIPSSKGISFLVGYFYFSGFFELHEQLKDKEVRILIGMEVEKELNNKLKEFYLFDESRKRKPLSIYKKEYFDSLVELINETNFCDTEVKQDAFRLFLEKLKNGSLEIKKTAEPNHAKLYIFERTNTEGGTLPGTVITGSSNLTLSGLKNRFEVNVISHEADDYKASKALFEKLWEIAKPLVNKDNVDEFYEDVIEKIWINKLPKPYLLYVRVLHELFDIPDKSIKYPVEITKDAYLDLEYQKDAIGESLDIINKHNGVIIADVVGLGKSIIASAVAHNLRLQTIIICPPHLRRQWEDYKRIFIINADIYSSGSIHKALADYENIPGEKLILVDEAHKYRNEYTDDYKNLQHLCSSNKVMLLSATPFNNKPQDIFSMIKLFQIPARSTIRTVDNLSNKFKDLVAQYKKAKSIEKESQRKIEVQNIANEIRNLLDPLVIRRSRIDLDKITRYRNDLKRQGIQFPKVNPPKLLDYDLGEFEERYIGTLDKILGEKESNGFIGARYKPTTYIKPEKVGKYEKDIEKMYGDRHLFRQAQNNMAKFMRGLLVHRFESCMYSFYCSIEKMITSIEMIESWYEKIGKIPVYKRGDLPDPEALFDTTSDDGDEQINALNKNLEELSVKKGYWYIDKKDIREGFFDDLKKDVVLLEGIKKEWFNGVPLSTELGPDPKIDEFKNELKVQLKKEPERKIVIFSGYADTAEYVYQKLKNDFRVFKYSSREASDKNKEIIRKNFDAGINSAEQADDYDVLIATDAISEGFNLHRAGTVINFDIPYNPTRVIQRVGRINRINKKVFDELFIYNYFPSFIGEKETRVKKISTFKIDMINALLGSDTKILTAEEDIESYYQEQYKQADQADNIESWDTKYRQELDMVSKEALTKALEISKRTRIRRSKKKSKTGILIFAKKGSDHLFKISEGDEHILLGPADALGLFQAEISEKAQEVSGKFEKQYQELVTKLFQQTKATKFDAAERKTIEKLSLLIDLFPEEKDYLEDLLYVMKDLESLPGQDAKNIRNLEVKKGKKDLNIIKELKKQIPPAYLASIINKANAIEEGGEALIVSEELI